MEEGNLSEHEMDLMVLRYLEKKKYSSASQALRKEASLESIRSQAIKKDLALSASVKDYILFYGDTSPQRHSESYMALRSWIDSSLDMYKVFISQNSHNWK